MAQNITKLLKQAQKMQSQMNKAQEELQRKEVEGTAGGGMVTVRMDGQKKCLGVTIDSEAAGDIEMLQDMVLAAFNEAHKKVEDETQQKMAGMLGGLGLPPGMF